MKKVNFTLFAILIILFSCEPETSLPEDVNNVDKSDVDQRLGTFTGTGSVFYYNIMTGDVEDSYNDVNVTVKVSNNWSDASLYNVSISFHNAGALSILVKKSSFSIQEDSDNNSTQSGSITISSSKCYGNVKYYNDYTNHYSSTHSWSCSK